MTVSSILCWATLALSLQPESSSGPPLDSVRPGPIHGLEIYTQNQWASNAITKWAMAGLAFGGDISSPLRVLSDRTHRRGVGVGGGSSRSGVALVLPSARLGGEPEKGRWQTTVALEHQQVVTAQWTPGLAHLLIGPEGPEATTSGELGFSSYQRLAATSLKVGGIRTHQTSLQSTPVDMTLRWSVNAGEMHISEGGAIQQGSHYLWDQDSLKVGLTASSLIPFGVGTLVSMDLGVAIEESSGSGGRPDRWSVCILDWGSARFRGGAFNRVDTTYAEAGLILFDGADLDGVNVFMSDTLTGTIRRRMPSTIRFQWDRKALRHPGVEWSFRMERNRMAPRPQAEFVRSSGRGAVRTTVGIGYGGWGGTYIPLNLEFAARAVRQGRPGGTLSVSTRWLALPGSGGRMALGLNWHQTF